MDQRENRKTPLPIPAPRTPSTDALPPDGQAAVCAALQRCTGHDFSRYKPGTLGRRIRRRMLALQSPSLQAYLAVLEDGQGEAELLLKELLIGVTAFFRDPEAFAGLAAQVLPRLLDAPAEGTLRVWVPGCATGEEAYSIAMLVRERLALQAGRPRLAQIFATDLDGEALMQARAGRYSADDIAGLSPERRERFFVSDGDGWRVIRELREMCIFSQHNLVRDPPFSSLDLITCRNVLIYLQVELQRRLFPLFHYALRPGGWLMLGPSEGLSAYPELFEEVDKTGRVFRRREVVSRPALEFPLSGIRGSPVLSTRPSSGDDTLGPQTTASGAFERMLLEEYAPASAIVNAAGDLLYLAGRIERLLQPSLGAPVRNLVDQAPGPIRHELRQALAESAGTGAKVVRERVPFAESAESGAGPLRMRITVRPLPGMARGSGLFAVVFEELPAVEAHCDPVPGPDLGAVELLERELQTVRAELRATIEDLEAANEELKSSNEELISTNEELQSSNEELQTSREEVQSVNEELSTVNAELQRRVQELRIAYSDLQNLFVSTEIATIFLDLELCVTKYTPAATALFRMRETDVGRPLADLAPSFRGADLVADARQALVTHAAIERQVEAGDGGWFVVRILPYRTVENQIAGVVATFADVSALKRAEAALRINEERYRSLFESMAEGVTVNELIRDAAGAAEGYRILELNPAAVRMTGLDPQRVVGQRVGDAVFGVDTLPFLRLCERVVADGRAEAMEVFSERLRRQFRIQVFRLVGSRFVCVLEDITARKTAEDALRLSEGRYRALVDAMPDTGILLFNPEKRFLIAGGEEIGRNGRSREDIVGRTLAEAFPDLVGTFDAVYDKALRGEASTFDHAFGQLWYHQRVVPVRDADGKVVAGMVLSHNITHDRWMEERMRQSEKLTAIGQLAGGIAHDFNNQLGGILGYAELLAKRLDDPAQRRYAEGIMRTAQRSADLTRQLLAFARKAVYLVQPTDVHRAVAEVAELLGHSIDRRVRVHEVLQASPSWTMADPSQLQSALLNLALNARDAMPEGGDLTFATRQLELGEAAGPLELRPGRYLEIAVTDTGCGMDEATKRHLFEPFFTTKGPGKGTGLGLAAVYGTIKDHHGAIAVESAPGCGSTFRLYLPAIAPPVAATTAGSDGVVRGSGRIMVVDDEPAIRDMLADTLRELGYEVITCADGHEAETAYRERWRRIDLVLLDLVMPRMDGRETFLALKAINPGIRALVISGFSAGMEVHGVLELGAVGFVQKPFRAEELAVAIANAMG